MRKKSLMNEHDLIDVKVKVLQEIEKTEKSIKDYRELTKPISPENAIGRISRMDAINNKSVAEAALRQVEGKLKNLHSVLNSMHEKDFGL